MGSRSPSGHCKGKSEAPHDAAANCAHLGCWEGGTQATNTCTQRSHPGAQTCCCSHPSPVVQDPLGSQKGAWQVWEPPPKVGAGCGGEDAGQHLAMSQGGSTRPRDPAVTAHRELVTPQGGRHGAQPPTLGSGVPHRAAQLGCVVAAHSMHSQPSPTRSHGAHLLMGMRACVCARTGRTTLPKRPSIPAQTPNPDVLRRPLSPPGDAPVSLYPCWG